MKCRKALASTLKMQNNLVIFAKKKLGDSFEYNIIEGIEDSFVAYSLHSPNVPYVNSWCKVNFSN
jgi:hypothetical protein